MGWFSRKDKGTSEPTQSAPQDLAGELDATDPDFTGRALAKPLSEQEQGRITAALETLAARGVDVDDLASIGSAYDALCRAHGTDRPEESREACELIGIAIGEHLHRHSALKWAIVTDTFGTDLGLATARTDTVVVPHNLVSARWMRRETGWVPRVVEHLLRINSRR